MTKNKIIYLIVAIIIVILVVGVVIYKTGGTNISSGDANSPIVLYYSLSCPHCKLVEDFLNQNKISDKVSFANKEVSQNQANAIELGDRAQKCNISTDQIGVPFLWDGTTSKCVIGDVDVIQFFKDKAGIK